MQEMTQEEALRHAEALAGQAVKQTEARCRVLAQFIDACEAARSKTSDWSDAASELSALHGYRSRLLRRRGLIQEALNEPIGECPRRVPLPPSPMPVESPQRQVRVQARRRRS